MQRSAPVRWWMPLRQAAVRAGAWISRRPRPLCPNCSLDLRHARLYRELRVCDNCGHHFPLDARKRIETLADPHTFSELEKHLSTRVSDRAYAERVHAAERETHLREAVVIGSARVQGLELMLAVLDFRFLGGTMGAVVGEKIARAFDLAAERGLPLVAVTASGGARIHEGMLALMQMAKTTAAAEHYHRSGHPFITVLAHPTMGGVYASFANLADIIFAEPGAMIGFSGPRVIQVLTGQKPPSDSHRAEFLLAHGMVDSIIARPQLRSTIARVLEIAAPPPPRFSEVSKTQDPDSSSSDSQRTDAESPTPPTPAGTKKRWFRLAGEQPRPTAPLLPLSPDSTGEIQPWESVLLARHPERPTTLDYVRRLFGDFVELHGDRLYGDDPAIIAGLTRLDGRGVILIGQERGHGAESEKRKRGSAGPEGYRKSQRVMQLAQQWDLPVITFIDTPGAASTYEAEQRGIAMSLANSIRLMLELPVPTVAVVIGEGGSGGALALAAADRVLMLEHAVYSVISPEGASAILFGDASHAEELSTKLHLTARDLKQFGIIDTIVPEPSEGAHHAPDEMAARVRSSVLAALAELMGQPRQELLQARYAKYRAMGSIKK